MIDSRTDRFQHLVLSALWVLILFAAGAKEHARMQAVNYCAGAIRFGDDFGIPGEDAQRVRRNKTYGGEI